MHVCFHIGAATVLLVAVAALNTAQIDPVGDVLGGSPLADGAGAFVAAAATGDPNAQFNLATCYLDGRGVEVDVEVGTDWMWRAARGGHPQAMLYVGAKLSRTSEQSFEWILGAAEKGLTELFYIVGRSYMTGNGTAVNKTAAFHWFELSAESGDVRGQIGLATCYMQGDGTEQDTAAAMEWFGRAAAQGNDEARYFLGILRGRGDLGADIEPDEEAAAGLFEQCAENGHAGCAFALAVMHAEGQGGLARDDEAAFLWMERAARAGLAEAYFPLGAMHHSGRGTWRDAGEAVKWLRKASDADSAERGGAPSAAAGRSGRGGGSNGRAELRLGSIFEYGDEDADIPRDAGEAARWYRLSEQRGNPRAADALRHLEESLEDEPYR
jgi:uncharacterized protein